MSNSVILIAALVAALHLFFLWFEMFAWTTVGPRLFRKQGEDFFIRTRALAANQGLYNGFLAAGLVWGCLLPDPFVARQVLLFFFTCVTAAGIYGAFTVQRTIFFVQAVPAILGLLLLFWA